MKNLKRLGATATLTFMLSLPVLGDCPPPVPGQIETPPCTGASITPDDSAAPGEVSAPPASNEGDLLSAAEAAIDLLLIF